MSWGREMQFCRQARGRLIPIQPDGDTESARVLVTDVIQRQAYFEVPGVYVIRDAAGDAVVVGRTMLPLGVRLRGAIANKEKWTQEDFGAWTVAMVSNSAPGQWQWEKDVALEKALVAKLAPRGNMRRRVTLPGHVTVQEE